MFKSLIPFKILLFLFILSARFNIIYASVVINEFSSESSDDWVELYADSETDISEWVLRDFKEDGSLSSLKSVFPQGTTIGSSNNQFYIVDLNTRLNKNGDIIKLYSKDEVNLIDEISYGDKGGICSANESQTIGREVDGSGLFVRFSNSTNGATNNGAPQAPCPTVTPTSTPNPTDTPKPSYTPTPSKTPTPLPQATAIPTQTAKSSLVPTKKVTPTDIILASGNVLGEASGGAAQLNVSPTPTPTIIVKSSSFNGAKIALVLGLLFCGIAIMVFTQRIQEYRRNKT